MNPVLWADVARDLDAATRFAKSAVQRAASLEDHFEDMDDDVREDRQAAIGLLLHNCYGAMESALERIILAVDGTLPTSPNYHADLIRRARMAIEGARPVMISSDTAGGLQKLRAFRHVFRHAYDGYDYDRAAENVAIAESTVPSFCKDIQEFRQALIDG